MYQNDSKLHIHIKYYQKYQFQFSHTVDQSQILWDAQTLSP